MNDHQRELLRELGHVSDKLSEHERAFYKRLKAKEEKNESISPGVYFHLSSLYFRYSDQITEARKKIA